MTEGLASLLFRGAYVSFAVMLLVLGGITLVRGPRSSHRIPWVAFCFVAGLFSIAVLLGGMVTEDDTALIVVRLGLSLGCLSSLAFFLFVVAFVGVLKWSTWLRGIAVGWAGLLLALFWLSRLVLAGVTSSEFSRFAPVAGPLMPLYGLFLVYGWGGPLVFLIRLLRHSSGLKRTQTAYMLAAFSIGFVASFGTLIPALLSSQTLLATLPVLLFPLFPLTITYAIVRHRLWDIRTVAHQTAIWLVLSGVLLVPLLAFFWLAGRYLNTLALVDHTVLMTLVFLVAYWVLGKLQRRLNHFFYRGRFDRNRALDAFTEAMVGATDTAAVAGHLVGTLRNTVYADEITVVNRSPQDSEWRVLAGPDEERLQIVPARAMLERLGASRMAIDKGQLQSDPSWSAVREMGMEYLHSHRLEVLAPLFHGDQLSGLVLFGEKKNLRPYTREDLEFIERLGVEASVALSNALLFEQVDKQRRDLRQLADNLEIRVKERTGELQQANLQLEDANRRLLELDQAKSRFFANISHELRTPLTLILLPVESILEGEVTGRTDILEQLRFAQRSALELLRMINDILELSRLEEAQIRLRVKRFDMVQLAGRIAEFARPLARRKSIQLLQGGPETLSMEGDEERLERVLVNLVGNALKFTEIGGTVSLELADRGEVVEVSVSDTGIGIAPEDLVRVFERFQQVDSSTTRRHTGSGIGLALVKELVEAHAGQVSVDSQSGQGSKFTVHLPKKVTHLTDEQMDRVDEGEGGMPEWHAGIISRPEFRYLGLEQAAPEHLHLAELDSDIKESRILLVEDNLDVLDYLQRILGRQYEVLTSVDGEQAWDLLEKEQVDLVVADVMMPGISGLQLCERIKSTQRLQNIPVVLLTARTTVEHRIEGHQAGADRYLSKPFRPAELKAVIQGLLINLSRSSESAARRHAQTLNVLLAGMAHELRNALQQVQSAQGTIWPLVRRLAESGEGRMDLARFRENMAGMEQVSVRAQQRIAAVVNGLQQYALHDGEVKWENADWDELVEQAVAPLIPHAGHPVRVDVRLDSRARVIGPVEQLRELVINLVENALQAVGDAGQVEVATGSETGKLVLQVNDDGPGMAPEVRERIFDLFYTTKEPGKGMGLGLALCKKTVDDMGGTIQVTSRVGKGTRMRVELPRASGTVEPASP